MERIVNLHIEKLSEGLYLAIGENENLCREGWAKNHRGDNMTLDHFGEQNELAFHNIDMKYVVEPGEFEIMTGPSSRDKDLQKTVLTVI